MEGADYGTLGSSEKQRVQSERGSEVFECRGVTVLSEYLGMK